MADLVVKSVLKKSAREKSYSTFWGCSYTYEQHCILFTCEIFGTDTAMVRPKCEFMISVKRRLQVILFEHMC